MSDMRKVFLVLASSMALAIAACDSNAHNNQGPTPSSYGGGPASEGAKPAPSGSAAYELPGMGAAPPEVRGTEAFSDANGGSGAGVTGTKGQGTTLHNGLNDQGSKKRPPQEQKKIDMMPGSNDPTKKF
jgi:hypothetical protein